MHVPISEADGALHELVRRAQAGEDVVLTLGGSPAARIEPLLQDAPRPKLTVEEKRKLVDEIVERAQRRLLPGPDAAHSADFLYDEDGLPV